MGPLRDTVKVGWLKEAPRVPQNDESAMSEIEISGDRTAEVT
jgi:hypothetical protein